MKKSLFDANPYLRDSKRYREMLVASVAGSTAIETGADVNQLREQLAEYAVKRFGPVDTATRPVVGRGTKGITRRVFKATPASMPR